MEALQSVAAVSRVVLTLEQIVEQYPEIRAQDLLACARKLPALMADAPYANSLAKIAVGRWIEELVDMNLLPPWCGMAADAHLTVLRAS